MSGGLATTRLRVMIHIAKRGGVERPIACHLKAWARDLGVSPPNLSNMLARMHDAGLLVYGRHQPLPYAPQNTARVSITPKGADEMRDLARMLAQVEMLARHGARAEAAE